MICRNCGTEINGEKFCPKCGTAVLGVEENSADSKLNRTEEQAAAETKIKAVEAEVKKVEEIGKPQPEIFQTVHPQQKKENTAEADSKGKKGFADFVMIVVIIILVLVGAVALFFLYNALGKKEQFQGNGWYENADIKNEASLTENLSGVEVFAAIGENDKSSMAESWTYGNDMQIYSRGALLTMDEKYYYVANNLDDSKLYRISRDGSYSRERISDIPASMVSVRDDRLYFVSNFANALNTPGIYSIKTDGTEQEYISDAIPEYMILVNDWLYYLSRNDDHIYKMNIADRREIQLTDKSCVSMTMHENTIYFSYLMDEEDEDSKHILAAMDVDGNFVRELSNGGYYYYVMFVNGEIYYVSYEDECFSAINPDGTENRVVGWADLESGLQIYDGKYYFIDASQNRAITVYDEVSGSAGYYDRENIRNFFIFDQKLYINYLDGVEEKISIHNLADGSLVAFFG